MGFEGGNIDPCIYIKKSENGIVYVALYIHDNLTIWDVEAIDDAIADLKENRLVIKIVEGLQDYLSFEIIFNGQKEDLMRTASSHCESC